MLIEAIFGKYCRMSSQKDIEVYIPENACVRNIPVESLPASISRKMGIRQLYSNPDQSGRHIPQTAVWISPVELREKGGASSSSSVHPRLLIPGQFLLPIVSSNRNVLRLIKKFHISNAVSLQSLQSSALSGAPDPEVLGRPSRRRRNAIILYDKQIYLSVRKPKTMSSGREVPPEQQRFEATNSPAVNSPVIMDKPDRSGDMLRKSDISQKVAVLLSKNPSSKQDEQKSSDACIDPTYTNPHSPAHQTTENEVIRDIRTGMGNKRVVVEVQNEQFRRKEFPTDGQCALDMVHFFSCSEDNLLANMDEESKSDSRVSIKNSETVTSFSPGQQRTAEARLLSQDDKEVERDGHTEVEAGECVELVGAEDIGGGGWMEAGEGECVEVDDFELVEREERIARIRAALREKEVELDAQLKLTQDPSPRTT